MRRRDIFPGLGYSVLVSASSTALAQIAPSQPPAPREQYDRLVPRGAAARRRAGEPNMTLVDLETDVFIAGGGLAGVCAALAAARNGARVILVQDRSRLGGNSSSEVKMHVVGATAHKKRPGWRESGLIEELRLDDATNNPQRCWEMWDLLLYDKIVSEPNITLLLETVLYSATTKDGRITEVMGRSDKSEHLYRVKARVFLDCTGDSRLGLEAGAEMRSGREPRSEFGETLAPEKADGETLGSSILFTSRLYRKPMPFRPPAWARKVTAEQLKFRSVGPHNWEYGYWWIEWGGHMDPVRDNERIRFELLSIVTGVWDYIKNSGDFPSSDHYALDWIGMMPGKRGSRRLNGDHILTQQDLQRGGQFEDAVAMGGWPLDDHPADGFDRPQIKPNVAVHLDEVYDIPLRSLYSKNISNLMMAGRNISASHVAFTSARVMATCACIGQAAGAAAAICAERGLTPRDLYRDKKLLSRLQQTLLRDDQSLKSIRNQDPSDLAREAKVTATAGAGAERILDGFTRDIPDDKGNPVVKHHWAAPAGSSIDLAWARPQRIGRVQLTFDSGFQRELTLSSSDSVTKGIVREPQPETVRDYTISYMPAGGGDPVTVAKVTGNHQRLRRHTFPAVDAKAIRVTLEKTNGLDEVRLFEVRCSA